MRCELMDYLKTAEAKIQRVAPVITVTGRKGTSRRALTGVR